uniref:UDP-galactose transporter n=1 Tax=Elaeophora elaphi TaxID=1147741 RepID=A0A0R3RRH5_9BILA
MPLLTYSTRYRISEERFLTTVIVFIGELVKFLIASIIVIFNEASFTKYLLTCYNIIIGSYTETLKVCLTAIIYTIQNNLYYIAFTHLEPTTYCLIHQIKIFITALMLWLMLDHHLSWQQWFALLLLAIGIADIQIQHIPANRIPEINQKPLLGFIAVITMCFTSAFASVYLEKVLKRSSMNIWMQNVRLALLSIPINCLSIWIYDYAAIKEGGMFRGFDMLVWILILMNSAGGLLISVVIKYADNIAKTYAQSASVLGATFGSWILFNFTPPSLLYCLGGIAIITSVIIYNSYPHKKSSMIN